MKSPGLEYKKSAPDKHKPARKTDHILIIHCFDGNVNKKKKRSKKMKKFSLHKHESDNCILRLDPKAMRLLNDLKSATGLSKTYIAGKMIQFCCDNLEINVEVEDEHGILQ